MTYDPAKDGVDHINVYSKGKTVVGHMLSNFYSAPFTCIDGAFRTVEGYWYWLSCRDDRLRTTSGYESKKLGRELRGADWVTDPEFIAKIKAAIFYKVEQHPYIKAALVESTLPLDHYYVGYGGRRKSVPGAAWLIEFLEALRREYQEIAQLRKEGRAP